MSKKRPGVKAGMNLVSIDDAKTWEKVEEYGKETVTTTIPNLKEYERNLERFKSNNNDQNNIQYFTKDQLQTLVKWKHTVGKNRIFNIKHLDANSDESVREHSRTAIRLAMNIKAEECVEDDGSLSATGRKHIQEAIGELQKLKGVGPATASAVLTLVRPDLFCYLYDEVIDCFEPQRDYKISNYLRVNSRCLQIAKKLGTNWTPQRVAKTIWTAARFLAIHGEDLSQMNKSGSKSNNNNNKKNNNNKANNNRGDSGNDESDEGDEEEGEEDDEEDEVDEEDDDDDDDGDKKPEAKRMRKS